MNRLIVRSFSTSRRLLVNDHKSAGSIREAGGAFGKMEAAREEEYFRKLQAAQFKSLKDQLKREVEHHESQAKNHAELIERHKKRIQELEAEEQTHHKNH
ncbi:Uridine 5'-monophosphate synthase [Aphelenchoides besseyi]|nr:Uridine 5'-monophosphate synthase [Aphelenchoides besseyi]